MRFTLKQINYFVAASEAGSILKASENIHVSQPAISSAISQLEKTFGITLFVRHHAKGMSLTAAGREFFGEAKSLLNQAAQLQSFAGELSDQIIGTIELGCFIPLAPIITPDLCQAFNQSHSNANINVREAHQADLLRLMQQGTIDLALTYDLQLQSNIEFLPLATLPPYVLLSIYHVKANQKQIELSQLENEPMILLDLPLSSEYFMSLFHKQDLKPTIKTRTHLTDVQRGLVASGHGYSLANVRPKNKQSLDGKGLKYIRLKGQHTPLSLGIAMLKDNNPSQAQLAFIEHCKNNISSKNIPGMIAGFD